MPRKIVLPGSARPWSEEGTMNYMDQKAVALLNAAASGHHHLVPQLLVSGASVNGGDDGSRTPLHVAALAGHESVVKVLIKEGAHIEAISSSDNDKRALHLACQGGCGVVRQLLQAGADIEAREKNGWSPLHEASVMGNAKIVRILLEAGANTAATGLGRWQAMHRAALWGHVEVIHALLDGGADIEAQGIDDCRPIHYAAMRGQDKVLEALVERGCDLFARDGNGATALHCAAGGGQLKTVQWLVGKNIPHTILDGKQRTAEEIAQIYGYHHVKWWLYKQTPDAPPSHHKQLKTSLEECERIGKIAMDWAVNGDHDVISSQVPNRPWRIHFQDAQGWSLLHHAASNNKKEVVEALVKIGACKLSLNYNGQTPADLARSKGHFEVANLLTIQPFNMTRSKKIELFGQLLKTISCAERQHNTGGDQTEMERRLEVVQEVTRLVTSGAPLQPVGGHTVYPLHLAISSNCTDLIPLLLSVGAPLTSTTGRLGILQQAWLSPDVTTNIAVIVTRAVVNRMEYEKSLVSSKSGESSERTSCLVEGISYLLDKLRGEEPWEALWPSVHKVNFSTTAEAKIPVDVCDPEKDKEDLTSLLMEACQLGATLTASFLVRSGASTDSSCVTGGETSLHAALDASQLETAASLVQHLGANIYLQDAQGRLPLTLCPFEFARTLQEDALCHDFRVLDFLMCKAKSIKEKERSIHILLLLAILSTGDIIASREIITGEPNQYRQSHKVEQEVIMDHEYGNRNDKKVDPHEDCKIFGKKYEDLDSGLSAAGLSSTVSANACCSTNWKFLFVDLVSKIKYDSATICDSWLRKLLRYITKDQDVSHDYKRGVQYEEKKTDGKKDYQGRVGEDSHYQTDIDDNDEELFFKLLDKVSQMTLQESNISELSFESNEFIDTTLHQGFQVACENGLFTMIHLILTVGGVGINDVLEMVSKSTALHVAASRGRLGVCNFLLNRGASKSSLDVARRTPAHLAFMFGHSDAGDLLVTGVEKERDMANACPKDLLDSFKKYMEIYGLDSKLKIKAKEKNDATGLIRAHLRHLKRKCRGRIDDAVRELHVNFTKGEAKEVKEALTIELKRLSEELEKNNSLFANNLHILGSSADDLRLFAPDEFDCNVVLKNISGFPDGGLHVTLKQLPDKIAQAKGYNASLSVSTADEKLGDLIDSEIFVNKFFEAVSACVTSFQPLDHRLSLVLPGIQKTQVGANVSFAWQGLKFPLLLINVDLVPVVNTPWPVELERPPMTPSATDSVQIIGMEDGNWRFSFAAMENLIFRELPDTKRMVLLACKLFIVSLRVETWATRDIKEQFTYWDGRRFKIPAPAGFILKSAFLREMENVQDDSLWEPALLMTRMKSVFRRMCIVDDISDITETSISANACQSGNTNTQTSTKQKFFHGKVRAYFGGECEKASVGYCAPEILRFLESW